MVIRKLIFLFLVIVFLSGCSGLTLDIPPPAVQEPTRAINEPSSTPDLPSPSPTAAQVTSTPEPTATQVPTLTPLPTDTPDITPGIILFIGDGMGAAHRQSATWLVKGEGGKLAMDSLPVQGWAQTANINDGITDSAAAGTAFATGHQTYNSVISMDPQANQLTTILEMAEQKGWATGLVTTVQMTHATPAVFAAHVYNRSQRAEIARQMIANDVDVLLGGGEDDFFSKDENGCYFGKGVQPRGSSLVGLAIDSGYTYLCNAGELLSLNPAPGMKLLGLFSAGAIPAPFSPSLAEMTQTALSVLSQDPDGFFLMVEAGQIDWAAHGLEAKNTMLHTVGLDTAVTMAMIFAFERENTLLIVAADHETGGMSLNKDGAGTYRQDGPFHMPDGTSFWMDWSTTSHTDANIPVTAQGPYSEMLAGEYHLTHIFETMAMMLAEGE